LSAQPAATALQPAARRRWRTAAGLLASAILIAGVAMLAGGCGTLGYYAQAVNGHLDLLQQARPIDDWLADPGTVQPLRGQLEKARRMRSFAVTELHLPDNGSYRRYADLRRNAAVWNVVAAPPLSLQLKTWCFPLLGCVGYRGYFERAAADALAAELRGQGLEVMVYDVPAYSSLGFSNWVGGDPLLNTFIVWNEGELAGLIFHELSHQVVYVADDTMFNESFAGAVERIGERRWLAGQADAATRAAFDLREARRNQFRELTWRWRRQLQQVYALPVTDDEKRLRKAEVMAAMRRDYDALKAGPWSGWTGYDGWFERANNAAFGMLAAYTELVPDFERLFKRCDEDFPRFYAAVRALADLPKDQRRARLAATP
jgi:predicted aminopeptidase